jgi:Zn-dependent peptidase ImmA (M78 family)
VSSRRATQRTPVSKRQKQDKTKQNKTKQYKTKQKIFLDILRFNKNYLVKLQDFCL